MTYDLCIGNGVVSTSPKRQFDNVDVARDPAAPPGWPTSWPDAQNNVCMVPIGYLDRLARDTGLQDVLFGLDGLLPWPFSITPLTQDHLQTIRAARERADPEHHELLDWIIWWMAWALEHCEHPAIERGGY